VATDPTNPTDPEPTGGEVDDQGPKGPKEPQSILDSFGPMPLMIIGMIVLMYVWMAWSKKKQGNKRNDMLANLKKGDKIRTIGGILGTIVEVRETEIVIKTDENAGTRMHFVREAIQVIGDEARKKPDDERK